ncbi:type IV secretory system conjugative DNA transfer family protein [Agrobacterium tumefaciens]|uniref:type IV secretory system conjugative DNA transfer family protein n=1 Tax=Agrobacterium tumefaciens TaxID=358 RepID=UPI0021D3D55D|nr:type IV secretory system conjugative DNA transfer family protein [Agrobacterium tumefaciens]UXS05566.1 type IV secretory system conjugative DNA transfer family protein [Agrobacterium tumefaciens]
MNRSEKIALIISGPLVAAGGAFYAWSLNYSAASWFMLKSSTMWKCFVSGQITMPVRQAAAYLDNPAVMKLITTASLATLTEVAILAGGLTLAIKRPWQVRPPADGSRFATREDLKKAGLLDGMPGKSILLGTFGKGRQAVDVRYSGDSHFFVNGPSRAGKGRGFVLTNLLEYEGSAIVIDVKLENYLNTGAARLAMGQKCYVFAPGSAKTHRWNPLDFVRGWPERSTDLINLSASLLPIAEKEDGYWKQTARGLLAGLLGYVLESKTMDGRRNFRSVLRMFSTGRPFSGVLRDIIEKEPELNDFILASFLQHLGRDEEQRPSFEGHVVTSLAPFNNLLMAEACAASDFDIRDLRRKPFSIFIAAPVSDFGTVEPIIRLLIQQIHDVMLRALPGKDEPHKILMMLDEFYQFDRLPEITKRAPLVAGYGLTIALVAQNIPQIDERYGQKTRDALLGNMDIKLCIAVGDDATAKIVSDNLGRKYEEREGWGRRTGMLLGKKASSGRFELVPLMDAGAVQRLDDNSTILQVRSGYGAILNKMNFYTDSRFLQRRREVEALASQLIIPDVDLQPEWPLFEARPKDLPSSTPLVSMSRAATASIDTSTQPDQDADLKVLARAQAVFVAPANLMHMYSVAVDAIENRQVAFLLFCLRTAPETIGALRGSSNRLDAKGRKQRESALQAIWPLREAITAVRWSRLAKRINARVLPDELFFFPTAAIQPETILNLASKERDEENNSVELSHAELTSAVEAIEDLITPAGEESRIRDNVARTEISAAIERLKQSASTSVLEDNQLPEAFLEAG